MTIGQRIREIRKIKKISQKELANVLECEQPQISDYENDKYKPSYQALDVIRISYNVNLDWLLSGEGKMFREELKGYKEGRKSESQVKDNHIEFIPTTTETPDADCNELDVFGDISAGEPTPIFDHEPIRTIPIGKSLLPDAVNCICFRVNGQSMEPDILHGDYVIIKQTDILTNLDGKVIAVRDPNGITLKVLFRDPIKRKYLLMPINPQYKPIPLDSDYHIIGYLKLVIRQYSD